jgi:hypothetical protein
MTTTEILELAVAMAEAKSKEELTLIKSRYSEDIIKKAWRMLDDAVKVKIKAFCEEPKPLVKSEKPVKINPKLWELSSEVLSLENSISEIQEDENLSDSEKDSLLAVTFETWLGTGKEFDNKACQVAAYIKHLEAVTEARKNEYRRLRELAEMSEKQGERLRAYLVTNMERVGKKKINGINASLSLRKKPAKVVLTMEPDRLPDEFKKVEITPRLSELRNHLKNNPECTFAQLSSNEEYSVTIK